MTVVTARHTLTCALLRRRWTRRWHVVACAVFALVTAPALDLPLLGGGALAQSAISKKSGFNPRPPREAPRTVAPVGNDGQMLVQAVEINYDYTNQRVAAVGNVQIYYNNSTLEADRVTYDQKTKRLHAQGNVRMTDADGRITYAEVMELSDDYRDGFVDSLRLETPDRTRMAAARADRTEGNYTVFQSGVYTACEPCKDDPKKPPLWQVKGARIIHDQGEKMLYFEQATLEFFGQPIAWLPYFSTPDPTVKRKSGFLMPGFSNNSKYGFGVQIPYYWALSPSYDVTLTPRIMTKQGLLMQAEWRQRLVNGSYEIRTAGIFQADKSYFLRDDGTATPGYRSTRGSIETSGQFSLNQNWVWGWDGTLMTDRTFFQDYGLSSYRKPTDVFQMAPTDAVSQLYLTGLSNRSYFDARTIHFFGFSEADRQSEIPVIHPVVDYSYIFDRPILGGELGYKVNFTSLSRGDASFDAISPLAVTNGWCLPTSADPAVKNPANCLLRGAPGTYSRLSAEMNWRRSITDSIGQVWTPFASLRGDVAIASIDSQPGVANYVSTGNTEVGRLMPAAGLEYRYPFINVQSWGTTTVSPVAQVIVRPNEQKAGVLPNEDAQSLTFDDANLFKLDKFSGWDRIEGGGRANVGIEATTQFNRGGFVNVLFGQSYQLFGTNSFATGDPTNTGTETGLETDRSDYVARASFQPNRNYTFTARTRLDEESLTVRRFELESTASFDRWSASLLYGNYDKQENLGFLTRREGVLGTASFKVAANWVLSGGARYDLDASKFNQTIFGASYIDDCFVIAMNYVTDYGYSGNPTTDHRIMLQIGLRTIGGTSLSRDVNGLTP